MVGRRVSFADMGQHFQRCERIAEKVQWHTHGPHQQTYYQKHTAGRLGLGPTGEIHSMSEVRQNCGGPLEMSGELLGGAWDALWEAAGRFAQAETE